jgi:DNA helicase-2/ATP-dependent DNA helicase PcrA
MNPNHPLVADLNPPQKKAVLHTGGPVLVLAGAGSGKTRVITVRIARLLQDGVGANHILAITFTNKAAQEMKERVRAIVGEEVANRVTLSTFHALGLRILREDGPLVGFPRSLNILDSGDQFGVVRQCLKQLNLDPARHDPGMVLGAISRARHRGLSAEAMGRLPGQRLMGRVYQAYEETKKAYQATDFDDLILGPIKLLKEHEAAREKWCDRYRSVLVDEFQDTNGSQLELVQLLVDGHRDVCVVGDDDQSIYGWRGADISNILQFEDHFPDATLIPLEQNYRSTGHILAAANGVISRNTARREKSLWTASGDGEKVQVVACKSELAEATFVALEIGRRKGQGTNFRDIGVLFRTAAQAQPLEEALRLHQIPYRLVGAHEFFERKEVKDVLAYLKLLERGNDRTSFMRAVAFPSRGVGPASVARFLAFVEQRGLSLTDGLKETSGISGLTRPAIAGLTGLNKTLRVARLRLDEGASLADVVRFICDDTGAREVLIRDPTQGPGGRRRWQNVESLITWVGRFEQARKGKATLSDLLHQLALERQTPDDAAAENKVSLMTLHAAKGLEWPICFMVGCQEGLLPHQRVLDEGDDLSEERRLFYVGITRAQRTSILTYGSRRRRSGGNKPTKPSRFLKDIPAMHRDDSRRDAQAAGQDRDETRRRFAALKASLSGGK